MTKNKIQFKPEDVLKVLEDWKQKSEKDKDTRRWINSVIIHNLVSPIFGLSDIHCMTLTEELEDKNEKTKEYYQQIVPKSIIQRAYAHNIHNLGMNYAHACYDMLKGATTILKNNKKSKELKDLARKFHSTLEEIIKYLPFTPVMEKIDSLNDKQRWYCNRADISAEWVLYISNRLFNPDFQRNEYYLRDDVSIFETNVREIFEKENIHIIYGKIEPILTSVDYLSYAIEPLFWNVKEHAFNPENDINERMEEKKFWKRIGVFGSPEKEVDIFHPGSSGWKKPADSGDYIIKVQDNGFGIKEEHLLSLFEKGFSTKKDKEINHGIGLWGVKQFVEKYGGTISVKTKLGEGTTFEFTIPYSHLNDFICVQAQPNK